MKNSLPRNLILAPVRGVDNFSPGSLMNLQERFAIWRSQRRKPREPIPETLWQAAISLAGEHPLSQISKSLRIEYSKLKRRWQETHRPEFETKFVETIFSPLPPGPGTKPLAEIASPSGHILRLFSSEATVIIKTFLTA